MSKTYNYHLGEIFPLTYSQINLTSFRLSPTIDRKLGNSLGWHFSKYFPNVVVVWEQGNFWILAQSETRIPPKENWKQALEQIQNKLPDKFGKRTYFIHSIDQPIPTALIIAQLAVRILQINCRFDSGVVSNQNRIMVKRECRFWAETIETVERLAAAICFTPKTTFLYAETLDYFFNNHPFRNEPEKLLTGLLVRDVDSNSTGTINDIKSPQSKILPGLSNGGVYSRHENFEDINRPIRLAILNFTSLKYKPFYDVLEQQLRRYKFKLHLTCENIKSDSLEELSQTEARAKVQTLVDEVVIVPPDLVLVFLPESDRAQDDSDGNSIYAWVSSRLLRRKIASQVIYENTMGGELKYILNQVTPGVLAKLGNLPFILAEPLPIGDYFVGLDISRRAKKNGSGSINACGCVRLYGKQGEFIRYQIATDSVTEGEEIPAKILQDFLTSKDFKNKTVLIYRDGVFRGNEVKTIVAWGKAINAQFILVECAKSQIPRLYNLSIQEIQQGDYASARRAASPLGYPTDRTKKISTLQQPTRGLALKLSSHEVILITTQVKEKLGVPQPLRLRVREEGISVNLKILVDTTLKLTLLHHGSVNYPQ